MFPAEVVSILRPDGTVWTVVQTGLGRLETWSWERGESEDHLSIWTWDSRSPERRETELPRSEGLDRLAGVWTGLKTICDWSSGILRTCAGSRMPRKSRQHVPSARDDGQVWTVRLSPEPDMKYQSFWGPECAPWSKTSSWKVWAR